MRVLPFASFQFLACPYRQSPQPRREQEQRRWFGNWINAEERCPRGERDVIRTDRERVIAGWKHKDHVTHRWITETYVRIVGTPYADGHQRRATHESSE